MKCYHKKTLFQSADSSIDISAVDPLPQAYMVMPSPPPHVIILSLLNEFFWIMNQNNRIS